MHHIHFDEIDSTNAYAKAHYAELEDLSFVSASFQSGGKGREERVWSSPKGENLLFSCVIKSRPIIEEGSFLSLIAAGTVAALLEEEYGLVPEIKWPNDVYVNDRKIAGILLEGVGKECVVIGIGLNVNQTAFEGDYRIAPTSIRVEFGREVNLDRLREKIFHRLYVALRIHEDKERFLLYYKNHDYLLGKKVHYEGGDYVVSGVDGNFSLLLRDKRKVTPVVSGEIQLL